MGVSPPHRLEIKKKATRFAVPVLGGPGGDIATMNQSPILKITQDSCARSTVKRDVHRPRRGTKTVRGTNLFSLIGNWLLHKKKEPAPSEEVKEEVRFFSVQGWMKAI